MKPSHRWDHGLTSDPRGEKESVWQEIQKLPMQTAAPRRLTPKSRVNAFE